MESKFLGGGCGFVHFSNLFYVISLTLVIDGLLRMVFACLLVVVDDFEVVVEFFEVVLGGCRSFLRLVTEVP